MKTGAVPPQVRGWIGWAPCGDVSPPSVESNKNPMCRNLPHGVEFQGSIYNDRKQTIAYLPLQVFRPLGCTLDDHDFYPGGLWDAIISNPSIVVTTQLP